MPPKKHKKGNQNVQGKPAKRIRRPSRRIIEATSAVSETSDVHVPCTPASTSGGETINVNLDHLPSASQVIPQSSSSDRQDPSRQPRPQGQLPTDQSLQHSVGTSATGTTINFSPDVLSVQNSAFNQSSVGSVVENQCIGGLITGEQVQVSRPAAEMSIGDPIGSHVPVAIREKIWAGAYIDLPLLLKQARDLRTDPHITGELVIKNGQLVIEKQHLKPINNINTWTTAFTIFMSIYLEKFPETRGEVIMGLVIPFVMPRGPEPKPSTRGPTLTGLRQDSNPAKVPVSYLGPSATAMPLIGGPALSTPAGLDIDANIAEDPTLKPIARGKTKSVRCIPLYSLGSTPIVYNNLCIELDSYPFQNDKLQLVRAQGSGQGQFLVHFDGKPLTRYQFSAILAKSLQFCEGKIGRFKSHSFRIGAATEAAMRGIPDQVIKQWGRWKSESYASYIRF
uniref:Tyr recombinase domain-containing protein n=1 Tax=Magallana gigas TaxID=29159 RepID=A0A8W8L937_MAGGI